MVTVTQVLTLPDCQIHAAKGSVIKAKYDAKTNRGPWAYMCEECFNSYGVGLGTGRGQELKLVK